MKKRILFVLILVLIVVIGYGIFENLILELPPLSLLEDYEPSLVTEIYSRNNEIVDELYIEKRKFVHLKDIPVDLQNAIIAVEDTDFFRHWGINIKGIIRAMWKNIRAGRIVQGGSTLTQQLAKVMFLTRERTLKRKIKELLLAILLEERYSKQEILEFYLNQIYFGKGAYGVEQAAKVYFNKSVKDLNLAECALLAGLPRAPARYSPFKNLPRAYRRRAIVLKRMRKLGFISEEEEKEARATPIVVVPPSERQKIGAYFVEEIRKYLEEKYGYNMMYKAGLKVYTTMDLKIQEIAERVLNESLDKFDEEKLKEIKRKLEKGIEVPFGIIEEIDEEGNKIEKVEVKVQGAVIVMDPKSGEILAIVGGRNFRESKFNRAFQARRQPGSSFKLFTYTCAIDKGYTVVSKLDDTPRAYIYEMGKWKLLSKTTDLSDVGPEILTRIDPDKIWIPQNYTNKYRGETLLFDALRRSVNVCAVDLIMRIGPLEVLKYARSMGITSPIAPTPSLTLGGYEVTLLEMVKAYACIANRGVKTEPFFISRIEDNEGNILEVNTTREQRVISEKTAYIVLWLLQQVCKNGTGWYTKYLGRPRAGKTGTTNMFTDAWFIGFTPQLICGVWVGYDKKYTLGKRKSGGVVAAPIWTKIMKEALEGKPVFDFIPPSGIVFVPIDKKTGLRTFPDSPDAILAPFISGTEPVEFSVE